MSISKHPSLELFTLKKKNVFALPILHYNMELAFQVKLAIHRLQPDCIAVELPQSIELQCLHAASRLPDITLIAVDEPNGDTLYTIAEPCDASFEALRTGLELKIPSFCIDLPVENYPLERDILPDAYAINSIGLKSYYESYAKIEKGSQRHPLDVKRELFMAKRLKELSLQYDQILFISGFYHVKEVLNYLDLDHFPTFKVERELQAHVLAPHEDCIREILAESGWVSVHYEAERTKCEEFALNYIGENLNENPFFIDRQKLLLNLYKASAEEYKKSTGNSFESYHLRNSMKFVRNYALLQGRLMPDLYQILAAARSCVDHNYSYEVWKLATDYPFLKNIDSLPTIFITAEQLWGNTKRLHFNLKQKSTKGSSYQLRKKGSQSYKFSPPSQFSLCSYPPEDVIIERFGTFLKNKSTLLMAEEASKILPFSTSLEDGVDVKETLRHWHEKKLYVKKYGRPIGAASTVVVIFDEDYSEESENQSEKYPWKLTWIGEHSQESDMAFYSTSLGANVVGPGISRCEYGGLLLSSPPRRMMDVWEDPDYEECKTKAEVLLRAAIDYAIKNIIVYVAAKPPKSKLKDLASKRGKKIVYIPLGHLSTPLLDKIRRFHVLDGYEKRNIAEDYIF